MTSPVERRSLALDESAESLLEWMKPRARLLGGGVLVVAALAVITWLVRASNERKEDNAARGLAEAQRSVASENLPLAAADLRKLADRYGSTRAGIQGKLLLAQVLLQQGQNDSAQRVLDGVGSAGPLVASVHALRAAALEQAGRAGEAAAEYERAAAATALPAEAESFRADAARAFLQAGRQDDALRIWRQMAADPASALYGEAQLRVGELTAKAK